MAVLNSFRSAKGAEYRHGERKSCLKGTRGTVLNGIELWATDFGRSPVYWLNGLAGTGKSTIAKTIADRLFSGGQLGASFFCSRDFEDRSNLTLIFPTLAIQLARKYEEFRSSLVPLIQRDPEIASESLYSQMDKLIVQPLSESDISTVIVIDALDECKDEESASAILSVLGRLASKIPKVKFFLTGRPEPRISKGFRLPLLAKITDRFVLHEVEPDQVDSDIRLFFKNGFSELGRDLDGLDDWPTEKDLDQLCEQAAGLFVYAEATVKFVNNDKWDHRERLNNLLRSQKIGGREGKTLDSLYMSILQGAFGDDDAEDQAKIRSVLGTIVLAVNPLSPSAIATLLRVDAKNVHRLLSSVNSLLILHENVDHPVRPFHKSFPDFVTDPTRCTDERFHISPPDHHLQLLIGCLDLMNQTLRQNMCKLPDGVANSDVSDLKERIEKYIDPFLRYACMSWHVHLVDVHMTPAHAPTIAPTLHRLLETKFLFWLEVLSVLGAARNAVEALQVAADWLEVCRVSTLMSHPIYSVRIQESPTLDLVNDCFRFVTGYFEIIDASSPHIYHSALVVAPEKSIVRKLYGTYAHPFTRIVRGATMSWDTNTAATIRPSGISLVVWSSCNRFIAIAWSGWTRIDVLDSATLQRLRTHQPALVLATIDKTIVFSPDSRILSISRYSDQWLHVDSWDLQTGGVVSVIKWEGQGVSVVGNPSIAYSASGKVVGVLCRYDDNANTANTADVFIFDVATGTHIHSHSLNNVIPLSNDIWTHGEALRFATVNATTITIWEVGFTSGTTPTEIETLPTPENFGPTVSPYTINDYRTVRTLLLPSPCRLALAIEDRVLVWDVRNSKCLLDHTGTRPNPEMSFSSDGRFFACSATESEAYLWKESPTGYTLHEIIVSSGSYSDPLLSPNGESIVVSDNSTIRLWRMNTFTAPPSSTLTQAPQYAGNFLLDFSPNGTFVVVATGDDVVTVLDLVSGVPQLTIDTGMDVHGVRVVGNTVVVMGAQKVIAWDLPTGDCVPDARVSLEESAWRTDLSGQQLDHILGATISSDFRYVAFSTIIDHPERLPFHLHIYSASTGECLGYGKTAGSTLWFLPNGCDVWCSGGGREAEVWRADDERKVLELQGTVDIEQPPVGYPWTSSRGCRVTDDWWILGPDGKRLLMLPPPWQSDKLHRVWKGQLLALLHSGLSEPIIFEVEL